MQIGWGSAIAVAVAGLFSLNFAYQYHTGYLSVVPLLVGDRDVFMKECAAQAGGSGPIPEILSGLGCGCLLKIAEAEFTESVERDRLEIALSISTLALLPPGYAKAFTDRERSNIERIFADPIEIMQRLRYCTQ